MKKKAFRKLENNKLIPEKEWSISGKVVLVTGANTGIGKTTVVELVRQGAGRIIMACRNLEKARQAAHEIQLTTEITEAEAKNRLILRCLDLSSLSSVRSFAAEILETEPVLHVLINNAGIAGPDKRQMTEDGHEMTFQVNYLGHFLLTNLLFDLIKKSAPGRIVNVASDGYEFCLPNGLRVDDLEYEKRIFHPLLAYCQSKLCNILHARRLDQILNGNEPSGIVTFSLNPGKVDTDIYRHRSKFMQFVARRFKSVWVSAEEGAKTTIICACDPWIEEYSGKYWEKKKLKKLYSIAVDDVKSQKLWDLSQQMCDAQLERDSRCGDGAKLKAVKEVELSESKIASNIDVTSYGGR